jgi:hypothetical protein
LEWKNKELCVFFCSDKTGKFPEYPSDDEGGSALLFKEKTPEEVEFSQGYSPYNVFKLAL